MQSTRPSWTVNTVKILKKTNLPSRLIFISGSEGFLQIQSWKNYRELLSEIAFLIVLRNPSHLEGIRRIAREERLTTGKSFQDNRHLLVFPYRSPTSDLSSTQIRKRIRGGQSISRQVPPAVNNIIKEHKLYET
jgi:nicotinate-nucleotide adenylyltransferase